MSPPVGPTGLPQTCDGDHGDRKWRVGTSLGAFDTNIVFGGGRRTSFREEAVAASFDRRVGARLTLQLTAGAVIAGRIIDRDVHHRVLPGPLFALAGSYRFVDDAKGVPFVVGTFSLSQSFVQTRADGSSDAHRLSASDARLGVVVGKTFDRIAPFVVARAFGGPVRWSREETLTGSDRYKYQLGLGALFIAGAGVDGAIEVSFVGERRFTTGVGFAF